MKNLEDHKVISAASPGDPAYADAIASYNLLPQIHPAKTIIARSEKDVVDSVEYARLHRLTVGVLATGHGLGSVAPLEGSVLVRTAFDAPVRVDERRRVAHIPAGARWAAVVAAATPFGLAALHGSSGTVSAIGYLLRGGISFYGRKYGVAANSILSITAVLANGSTVTVSDEVDPELFWALRGGGGGLAIVTEVEMQLYPMLGVHTGITFWDAAHAAEIIPRYLAWARTAPREISTSLRLMNLPPLPGIPEVLAGRQVLAIDGVVSIEGEKDLDARSTIAEELLAPLRELAAPLLDMWQIAGPEVVPMTHMDPPDPIPSMMDSYLVRDLDESDVARLLTAAGPSSGSMITAVEFRQLGAAFAQPDRSGGAFDRTDADFLVAVIGAVGGPITVEHVVSMMSSIRSVLAHRDTGLTVPTFVESLTQPSRTFDEASYRRVEQVRTRVDPDGLLAPNIANPVEY